MFHLWEYKPFVPKNAQDQERVIAQSQQHLSLNPRHSPNQNPKCQRRVRMKTRHAHPNKRVPGQPIPK
eukprot:9937841-Prorocentrum_lima.AAC.1